MRNDETNKSLGIYMKDVNLSKQLSSSKEIELSERIKAGDMNALHELVKANLKFVIKVAKNYQNQGISLGDLISIGNVGLIKAAKRFDGKKNFKFITYAVWWIRQAILQAMADQSRLMRVPLNKVDDIYNLNKAMEKLEAKHRRKPSEDEIVSELNASQEDVRVLTTLCKPSVSLDRTTDEESNPLVEILADKSEQSQVSENLIKCLEIALTVLNDRERHIIKLYFGLEDGVNYTLEEIGEKIGLTRERVRQLRDRAIVKLKGSRVRDTLRQHLWDFQ